MSVQPAAHAHTLLAPCSTQVGQVVNELSPLILDTGRLYVLQTQANAAVYDAADGEVRSVLQSVVGSFMVAS